MRITSIVALLVIILCGPNSLNAAEEAEPSLDEMLKEYKRFGLPLPPKEAKLVRFECEKGEIEIAFLLKPETEHSSAWVLQGIEQKRFSNLIHHREVKPDPEAIPKLSTPYWGVLAIAIQCHDRGWNRLALHLLDLCRKESKEPLRKQFVSTAWSFQDKQITEPKSDRTPIPQRLEELMRMDKDLDTKEHRALIHSLKLALIPSKARPGSIEALIDDLVDYDGPYDSDDVSPWGVALRPPEPNKRLWEIAKLGFDAVPNLIDHLDDDRLTRAETPWGFRTTRTWNLRVGQIVEMILDDLAGDRRVQLRDPNDRDRPIKPIVARWWDEADRLGEKAYLVKHIVGAVDWGWAAAPERGANSRLGGRPPYAHGSLAHGKLGASRRCPAR